MPLYRTLLLVVLEPKCRNCQRSIANSFIKSYKIWHSGDSTIVHYDTYNSISWIYDRLVQFIFNFSFGIQHIRSIIIHFGASTECSMHQMATYLWLDFFSFFLQMKTMRAMLFLHRLEICQTIIHKHCSNFQLFMINYCSRLI